MLFQFPAKFLGLKYQEHNLFLGSHNIVCDFLSQPEQKEGLNPNHLNLERLC